MKIRNRILIRTLAKLLAFGSRWLYRSCRVHVVELAPRVSPYAPTGGEKYIYCVWHDGILGALFSGKVLTMSALASRHADGNYVADVMEAIGIQPIRGSNSQGGVAAVKQMLSAAENLHVTVATDGPRGPRRVVKPGIVFLASHSGRRIVPIATSAVHAWRPRGKWTDLLVPQPFTTVYSVGGEPLTIPADRSRDELAPFVTELQRRMDELQEYADRLARGESTLPTAMARAA